jgi:hypothetical protein
MHSACIITFRAASPERLRNLYYVLRWLDRVPRLETLVIEQDEQPRVDAGRLPSSCRVCFVRNTGPFNKSWGFNVGFRAVSAEVLVFADADLLVNHRHLTDALEACAEGCEAIRPWTDIVDLTEDETRSLVAGSLDVNTLHLPARRGRSRAGEYPPFCGGVYVMRAGVYERLGGGDERFHGWGGEDDAMSAKVKALCTRVAVVRAGMAFHLHHPRHAALPVDDPDYRHNIAVLREYQTLSREAFEELCAVQRRTMGAREQSS